MDLGGIGLAICGFSLLCLGLLAVLAVVVLRFTGTTVMDLMDDLTGGGRDEPESVPSERRRNLASGQELRARAQSLDFDEAVRRHGGESSIPSASAYDQADNSTENSGLGDAPRSGGLRSRNRRNRDGYEIYDDRDDDGGIIDDFFG